MKEEIIHVSDDIRDVIACPANYPDEMIATALDYLADVSSHMRELKTRLEGTLVMKMQSGGATKLVFKAINGQEKVATMRSGTPKPSKDAETLYVNSGFDPLEIGKYKFEASWSMAKNARKFGGEKQRVIDQIFKPGDAAIVICPLKGK
ncbi:MAG TPA: hypothetical protein PKM65_09470 [Spirochaetota bacterium]|nr:hypothetical protein [Spirochaetota bacterium]HNT12742.1 hypothetical protein [Spirochaetota bacterium]